MKFSTAPIEVARPVRVGVFDSGVGGLSVLRELRRQLPDATLRYVADSGHAPYGERSDEHVIARSLRLTSHLIGSGAQVVVIACNTATAVAAGSLRETWPQTPIIGVEPGIKPALIETRTGHIGVMATRATLGSERFRHLTAALITGEPLHLRACDGLAAAIERGFLDDPQLIALVEHHCAPLRNAGIDTVVLGCTHYTFVQHHIRAALGPTVRVIDTAAAVARHAANTARAVMPCPHDRLSGASSFALQTTGDPAQFKRIATAWLGGEIEVSRLGD